MYLVCPKCRRAAPSILIKTGFTCPFCQNSWEAPAIQFSQAYFCDLNSLSVALLAAGGERFRINTFPAVLGRDSEFKELQRNLAVSRNHFRIDANGTNISVTDLGSRGGTFLNQSQLAPNLPQPFNPGDVLRVSGVELTLELVFSPTKGRSQPIAPGPETIQLSNSNPILTIGGIASTANIKLAHLVYPEIIGCLHTQTAGDTWEVLALKHGSILANGESVLEYRLQPDDDIIVVEQTRQRGHQLRGVDGFVVSIRLTSLRPAQRIGHDVLDRNNFFSVANRVLEVLGIRDPAYVDVGVEALVQLLVPELPQALVDSL